MTDLTDLTLADARDGLAKKAFSARELTQAHLDAIEKARTLNAYVLETPRAGARHGGRVGRAPRQGRGRPARGAAGRRQGPVLARKGVRATACSKILDGFIPAYESTVTANLWRAGAVMLGKINCDEFAMGSSNETSAFGPVVSPWRRDGSDAKIVPGGSSGGSAAAVSARLALAATATDTGGSIRQPAAFTGTVGIKADLRALLALGHRRLPPPRSTRPARSPRPCATRP